MFIRSVLTLCLFLLVGLVTALAQKGSIRGKIIDNENGEGLFGATAIIAGTTIGGAADFDGNYSIDNVEPEPMRFSFPLYPIKRKR